MPISSGVKKPVAAILICALLIAVMMLIIARLRKDTGGQVGIVLRHRRTLWRTNVAMRCFLVLAVGSAIGAVATLGAMFMLPRDGAHPQRISVGQLPFAHPEEGPAILDGQIDWQHLTRFDQDLVVSRRSIYFAPIVQQIGPRRSVRYYVQVLRSEFDVNSHPYDAVPESERVWDAGRVVPKIQPPIRGILWSHGLPDELVALYAKVGIRTHPDHFALYRSEGAMRWRYVVVASEFALFALGALAIGLILRWQLRRLQRAHRLIRQSAALGTGTA